MLPHLKKGKKSIYQNNGTIESILDEWEKVMRHHKEHSVSTRKSHTISKTVTNCDPKEDYESLLEYGANMMTRMKV